MSLTSPEAYLTLMQIQCQFMINALTHLSEPLRGVLIHLKLDEGIGQTFFLEDQVTENYAQS